VITAVIVVHSICWHLAIITFVTGSGKLGIVILHKFSFMTVNLSVCNSYNCWHTSLDIFLICVVLLGNRCVQEVSFSSSNSCDHHVSTESKWRGAGWMPTLHGTTWGWWPQFFPLHLWLPGEFILLYNGSHSLWNPCTLSDLSN